MQLPYYFDRASAARHAISIATPVFNLAAATRQ
jgi:hypothetical protein